MLAKPRKPVVAGRDSDFMRTLKQAITWIYDELARSRIRGDGVTFRVSEGPRGLTGHATTFPLMIAVIQNGRYRAVDAWNKDAAAPTGAYPAMSADITDYLFVPFNDAYLPYYISKTLYEKASTAANAGGLSTGAVDISSASVDKRKNGEYFRISEHAGIQHVIRS